MGQAATKWCVWPHEKKVVPEHPWAGASLESWTFSRYPSPPEWRPHPRQSGYKVEWPWTERSGHSGCSETGRLQKKQKNIYIKTHENTTNCIFSLGSHVGQEAPDRLVSTLSRSLVGFCGSDLCDLRHFLHLWLRLHCSPLQNNPSFGQKGHH